MKDLTNEEKHRIESTMMSSNLAPIHLLLMCLIYH